MKVLLFEQWHGGHYTNYLNALLPELSGLSTQLVMAVNVTMQRALRERPEWQANADVTFAPVLPDVSPSLRPADRYAATRNLLRCIHSVRPDFVILPSADAQTTGLAVLHSLGSRATRGAPPMEGTLHYGYGFSTTRLAEQVKELVYSQTYRRTPYASVNFVNFAYFEFARAKRLIEPSRMRLVGDPVPQPKRIGREAARRLLGLDPAGRYLGLFGMLDRRKAIPELLAAFKAAALPDSDRLVLGGRLDPAYAELLASGYGDLVRAGRIVVLDRYLSDRELECAYEALDVATIVYYNFPGLASLALKAVAAGTPVIAHDFGWLRALVRRFEVGETTNIHDTAKFAACLCQVLEAGPLYGQTEATRRLMQFHDEQNFVTRMTSGLRRVGGFPARESREWDWVLNALPAARRSLW